MLNLQSLNTPGAMSADIMSCPIGNQGKIKDELSQYIEFLITFTEYASKSKQNNAKEKTTNFYISKNIDSYKQKKSPIPTGGRLNNLKFSLNCDHHEISPQYIFPVLYYDLPGIVKKNPAFK
nr:hypothetical protein [uncultured Desulfobacter sp.]